MLTDVSHLVLLPFFVNSHIKLLCTGSITVLITIIISSYNIILFMGENV